MEKQCHCMYKRDNGKLCGRLIECEVIIDNITYSACHRHMCHYCDLDQHGSSCYNFINNDKSKYCKTHTCRCTFLISGDQKCLNECQYDEEACDHHRCRETWCHNRYVIDNPKRLCQYHMDKLKGSIQTHI